MLQRENIQVPHEVAIVGFDDFQLASLLALPLTAVRQPAAELGRSATTLLLDSVRSRSTGVPLAYCQIVLLTELITRRSCGCEVIRRIDSNATPSPFKSADRLNTGSLLRCGARSCEEVGV